jgi:intracellular sulfur oxidation DsrE/DsrF family protein
MTTIGWNPHKQLLLLLAAFLLMISTALHATDTPNDHDALKGLKRARVVFDVRVPDSEKLIFNLALINETLDGMLAQGVKPTMVVAFRGPGVELLTDPNMDADARDLFKALKARGVRFEVCSVAMRAFKVDPTNLIPEVKLVANVFNSFVGYQSKGYALIAIN